jgi:hypothetical protein
VKKLAVGLVLIALACSGKPERRMTDAELRMIATAQSLTEWGLAGLDARAQTIDTIPEMDGSLRVQCKYDSRKIPDAKQGLYHLSEAQFFTTVIEAENAFRTNIDLYRKGVEQNRGMYVHMAPELLKMGDESYAAYMQDGKKKVGNIFLVRRGRVLHTLIVSRVYFDEAAGVRRLFAPMIEAARKFEAS